MKFLVTPDFYVLECTSILEASFDILMKLSDPKRVLVIGARVADENVSLKNRGSDGYKDRLILFH